MKTLLLAFSLTYIVPIYSQNHQLLPTVWKSFTAIRSGESVVLYWSTLTETPTVTYVLQHSKNAKDWQELTTVNSQSSTVIGSNYQYLHARAGSGDHYYRILLRDINLIDLSSPVRKISMDGTEMPFEIAQNPTRGKCIQLDCSAPLTIQLYTSSGNLLFSRQLQAGRNDIVLGAVSSGVYIINYSGYARRVYLQ